MGEGEGKEGRKEGPGRQGELSGNLATEKV